MIDFDKVTGLERNQIKDICFQMEQAFRELHAYNYFVTKPDTRIASVIVAIQSVEKKLDRMIELMEQKEGENH